MSFNHSLATNTNPSKLNSLGFVHHNSDEDPRGHYWELKNKKFRIYIDAWFEVTLERIINGVSTDPISVLIDSHSELEYLAHFITDDVLFKEEQLEGLNFFMDNEKMILELDECNIIVEDLKRVSISKHEDMSSSIPISFDVEIKSLEELKSLIFLMEN